MIMHFIIPLPTRLMMIAFRDFAMGGWLDPWIPLHWLHNGRGSVSNHQPHNCLLNRLFKRRSKKTSKLRVTGLCVGNSPGTGEFPAQMASNAENASIWWRYHALDITFVGILARRGDTVYCPSQQQEPQGHWCVKISFFTRTGIVSLGVDQRPWNMNLILIYLRYWYHLLCMEFHSVDDWTNMTIINKYTLDPVSVLHLPCSYWRE